MSKKELFIPYAVDGERWNKLYPYQLLVIDISDNQVVTSNSDNGGSDYQIAEFDIVSPTEVTANVKTSLKIFNVKSNSALPNSGGIGGLSYILSQDYDPLNFTIDLPITPQQLSITDQYAINTIATAQGIVEEHSGVRFKTISASGTTGIYPHRPTDGLLQNKNPLEDAFGDSIAAVKKLGNSINGIASAIQSMRGTGTRTPDKLGNLIHSGYYKALELQRFLERYVILKKNPINKNWRLVFNIPKQNQAYIVTPVVFTLSQSATKPMEYNWSMQLKAWKRVKIGESLSGLQNLTPITPSVLAAGKAALRKLRRALGDARAIIKAIRSDIAGVFEILREINGAINDVSSLNKDVAYLKNNIIQDVNSQLASIAGKKTKTTPPSTKQPSLSASTQEERKRAAKNAAAKAYAEKEGTSSGSAPVPKELEIVFSQPERFYDLFEEINVSELTLTVEQQEAIQDDADFLASFGVDDFNSRKNDLKNLAYDLTRYFGAGDETIANSYGKSSPTKRSTPLSMEENELLALIYEVVQFLDVLTSTKQLDDQKKQNPLQYVGGLANENSIPFEIANSKILVPVPHGLTIEQIAMRYLGNPDKWLEIVTLNNLKPPYLDETGYKYKLTSNATGRQFIIQEAEDRLYIGQKIIISSNAASSVARKIISVERIDSTTTLVSVDGEANLDLFKIADMAIFSGYPEGTTNSQNHIYLPLNAPSQPDDRVSIPNHLKEEKYAKISKIDLLLGDDGDIAINKSGDVLLSNGITNLIQALKLKIRTKKGTLLRHPNFGLNINTGTSIADLESGELIKSLNLLVTEDPRFSGVGKMELILKGPRLYVNMTVNIAGDTGIIPITFDV